MLCLVLSSMVFCGLVVGPEQLSFSVGLVLGVEQVSTLICHLRLLIRVQINKNLTTVNKQIDLHAVWLADRHQYVAGTSV